ncbi:MAG: ATP-dependent helicase DeaD [Patescibacteria group bacterium]|nr:ATP-dependent helicase DeaD [Patescibacteria group bacterium]
MAYYAYKSQTNNRNRRPSGGSGSRSRGNRRPGAKYIDPTRFVKAAKPVTAETEYVPTHKFDDFDVHQVVKTNLRAKGFVTPTPIQDQTIIPALAGKDIIGIANTGTGKTAAFAIPILHMLMSQRGSRALVVAPTRELAMQIEEDIRSMAKGSGLFGAVLIGGAPIGRQLRDLRSNPQIVIGTPGRIKDHIERRTLNLERFNMVVLDEVDRMLDMGFVDDVREILSNVAAQRQSFFFSATLDARVNSLIQTFSNEPVTISIKTGETSDNVDQNVIQFGGNMEKIEKLHDVLIQPNVTKAIIFDETQRSVERLSNELIDRGFAAVSIHGGKNQGQRQRALASFKANQTTILVATDVAARGIDVADVSHVINYTQPQSYEDYVHRIGRAGRAGKTGYALTFVNR